MSRRFFIPPTLTNLGKLATIQRSTIYTVTVTHHGAHPKVYQFVGPTKGPGPVVVLTYGGAVEEHVHKPGRYGTFGADWIRNYFSEPHQ